MQNVSLNNTSSAARGRADNEVYLRNAATACRALPANTA